MCEVPEGYIYLLTFLLPQFSFKWFSISTGCLFVEVVESTKETYTVCYLLVSLSCCCRNNKLIFRFFSDLMATAAADSGPSHDIGL